MLGLYFVYRGDSMHSRYRKDPRHTARHDSSMAEVTMLLMHHVKPSHAVWPQDVHVLHPQVRRLLPDQESVAEGSWWRSRADGPAWWRMSSWGEWSQSLKWSSLSLPLLWTSLAAKLATQLVLHHSAITSDQHYIEFSSWVNGAVGEHDSWLISSLKWSLLYKVYSHT